MRYRLTFTVNDNSEKAAFVEKQAEVMKEYGHDPQNIRMDFVVKQGCDIAKVLDQNPDHSIYSFYYADILEDCNETKNNTDCG